MELNKQYVKDFIEISALLKETKKQEVGVDSTIAFSDEVPAETTPFDTTKLKPLPRPVKSSVLEEVLKISQKNIGNGR
jgi:hypothetical protein